MKLSGACVVCILPNGRRRASRSSEGLGASGVRACGTRCGSWGGRPGKWESDPTCGTLHAMLAGQ